MGLLYSSRLESISTDSQSDVWLSGQLLNLGSDRKS